jgi:hypothetical protein
MSVWATVFAVMSAVQGVGDDHRGQWVPFWQQACQEDRPYACGYLAQLEAGHCRAGSGWACNELGILDVEHDLDRAGALSSMRQGCELGFAAACVNVNRLGRGDPLAVASPTLDDYPIILGGSKGPLTDLPPSALYARACSQGWPGTCDKAGLPGQKQ